MSRLFSPGKIGNFELPNRIIRSATAEKLADDLTGHPTKKLQEMWIDLVKGGTGLIITGHMYVHPSGKCHSEMIGIHKDEIVPELAKMVTAVHEEGGKIAVQINHGGMQCSSDAVKGSIAPSNINDGELTQPAREMRVDEIHMLIDSYTQAARRVKEAGFDAVQLHGAHGYLINQFISPFTNHREDEWGGDLSGRTRFLREVAKAVREEVGQSYPVFIKFGVEDGVDNGLKIAESSSIINKFEEMGLDAVEVSGGVRATSSMKGIKDKSREAYFRRYSRMAKSKTRLPVILVGGLRSKSVMEEILEEGEADFISMCRPLINDPYFPVKLQSNLLAKSECISSNNCWPKAIGEGISCKCPKVENDL